MMVATFGGCVAFVHEFTGVGFVGIAFVGIAFVSIALADNLSLRVGPSLVES